MVHSAHWFLISVISLSLEHSVISLNIPSTPEYSPTVEDALFQNSESADDHKLPQVNRRGYAGDDFYQKASKSIPRMGRRSEPNTEICSCASDGLNELQQNEELVELTNAEPSFDSVDTEPGFPWHTDRVPNLTSKRTRMNHKCYFSPKHRNYISNEEICNDNMICCPLLHDSSIFKRLLSSRISKQTSTSAPDYKSNQFM